MLEKTPESPLDCKEIQQSILEEISPGCSLEGLDAEAETPILWPPDVKSWLIGKDPDAGQDWRPEEKGTTEDGVVRWHHRLNGHEFEQALGVADGQGGLTCYTLWGCMESDTTEQLNWSRTMMWIQLWYREFPSPQRSFILLFYCHIYFILSSMPPTECDFSHHLSLIALYNVDISRML